MAKRVAQMGNTAEKVNSYSGIPKQLVVDTTNWRLRIMDGSTAGGHEVAMKSDITDPDLSPFLTKTDASTTYAKASEAATKTELSTGLAAKAPAYTYGTEDLTAGTSALETGKLYFVYEE